MKYNANKYCSKIKFLYCSISNSSIENYLYSYVCSIQVEKLNQVSSFRYQSLSSEELNLGIRMSQISHFQYHILLNPNLDPVSYMMNYLKRYLNLKTSDFSCKKKKKKKTWETYCVSIGLRFFQYPRGVSSPRLSIHQRA